MIAGISCTLWSLIVSIIHKILLCAATIMYAFASSPHPPLIFRKLRAKIRAIGEPTRPPLDNARSRSEGDIKPTTSQIQYQKPPACLHESLITANAKPEGDEDEALPTSPYIVIKSDPEVLLKDSEDLSMAKSSSEFVIPIRRCASERRPASAASSDPSQNPPRQRIAMKRSCSAASVLCHNRLEKRRRLSIVGGVP